MSDVTEKTNQLVTRWINAKKSVERARQTLNSCETDLLNAQNELGKWLMPEVPFMPNDGEAFNIWFGSGILQATRHDSNYEVKWRKEPDGRDRDEFGV